MNRRACPFCGCDKITEDEGWGIYCEKCGYGMEWDDFATNDEIISRWNTRPLEDRLQAELDRSNRRIAELTILRPMETAPRDGTYVLVAERTDEGAIDFHKAAWILYYGVVPRRTDRKRWCIEDSYQDEQGGFSTVDDPIGWLPIPVIDPGSVKDGK